MTQLFYGLSPVGFESVSNVTATNSVELGARQIFASDEYVYVYNAGGGDSYPYYGMKLVTGASGYSVANTSLANVASPMVGVIVHSTITAGYYGWVMVKGYAACKMTSNITFNYRKLAMGTGGLFIEALPVTDATAVGTYAAVAEGVAGGVGAATSLNTGANGLVWAFVKTGF